MDCSGAGGEGRTDRGAQEEPGYSVQAGDGIEGGGGRGWGSIWIRKILEEEPLVFGARLGTGVKQMSKLVPQVKGLNSWVHRGAID